MTTLDSHKASSAGGGHNITVDLDTCEECPTEGFKVYCVDIYHFDTLEQAQSFRDTVLARYTRNHKAGFRFRRLTSDELAEYDK